MPLEHTLTFLIHTFYYIELLGDYKKGKMISHFVTIFFIYLYLDYCLSSNQNTS